MYRVIRNTYVRYINNEDKIKNVCNVISIILVTRINSDDSVHTYIFYDTYVYITPNKQRDASLKR